MMRIMEKGQKAFTRHENKVAPCNAGSNEDAACDIGAWNKLRTHEKKPMLPRRRKQPMRNVGNREEEKLVAGRHRNPSNNRESEENPQNHVRKQTKTQNYVNRFIQKQKTRNHAVWPAMARSDLHFSHV